LDGKKIHKEKEDLYHLIHSLTNSELIQFRLYTKKLVQNEDSIYLKLFDKIKKQSTYDEAKLMKQLKLTKEGLRDSKFYLFNMILESLKKADKKNKKTNFLNEMMELNILKRKGLVKKAAKKFRKLKKIALINYDYGLLYNMLKHTDILILFNESEDRVNEIKLKKEEELMHYLELAENLSAYRHLSVTVLGLHYEIDDKRLERKEELSHYLNNPLLADEHMAKSDMAKYLYYEAKTLIYMGINDYNNASIYALKGLEFIHTIASPHRNDYNKLITNLSNYIHSRLSLDDIDAYHLMMPKMDALVHKNYDELSFSMKSKTFETKASLVLKYLLINRDYEVFEEKFDNLYTQYKRYEEVIHPNFKVTILFNWSKLFFIGGKLDDALKWCEELHDTQRHNPTHAVLVAGNILRIMIHYDMGKLNMIPHLVSTAEYYIKSRNRYFKVERCFIKGINKIKPFHSKRDKAHLFKKLYDELTALLKDEDEQIINRMRDIEVWIKSKF